MPIDPRGEIDPICKSPAKARARAIKISAVINHAGGLHQSEHRKKPR